MYLIGDEPIANWAHIQTAVFEKPLLEKPNNTLSNPGPLAQQSRLRPLDQRGSQS